ncbi:MAG: ornithine carbamoyltransferase [Candidatus Firestonebacteria bacterium]|nr:ornithine carbamoyltransferase [Candidatus Firestonebacteria bacterium]
MIKDFLTIADITEEEVFKIFHDADLINEQLMHGIKVLPLQGKSLGMIFKKSSTRTRVSFEVAMNQLGGHALFLDSSSVQMSRGETIEDTARVLSRYLNIIMIRTFEHKEVEELANFATIPVINGLTDLHHPCQILSDFYLINKLKGKLKGIKLSYIGDGNNIAHSLIEGAALLGINLKIAVPCGYEPDKNILSKALSYAKVPISISNNPEEAASGADILYTDVWTSMGQEDERQKRIKDFAGFQINKSILKKAKPDAIVMHCLPAHRGEEITDDVMNSSQSVIFDQAESRLHVQRSLLVNMLNLGFK